MINAKSTYHGLLGVRPAGLLEPTPRIAYGWVKRIAAARQRQAALIREIESQQLSETQIRNAFREVVELYAEASALSERLRSRAPVHGEDSPHAEKIDGA